MTLKGKVVVVTGSTRGIGRAIAEFCGRDGAKVVISSRKKKAVKATVKTFKQRGFKVTGIAADVSKEEDVQALLEHALTKWKKVHVWINNAGLSSGYRYLEDIPPEEISAVVNTNLTGTLYGCRLMIPYFAGHGGGVIINLNGRGGKGEAPPFMTTYAATKAAVTSLTKSLAIENKDKPVSIHSLSPGMVETDFYQDIKVSPRLKKGLKNIPYALRAFGVQTNVVGKEVARIAAQKPGHVTGKNYSLLTGPRMIRGIAMMTFWRVTGKLV
jgi:NAD(P)-dependent dehydrogenase (short-subunit alcohol dehydrogenase family)